MSDDRNAQFAEAQVCGSYHDGFRVACTLGLDHAGWHSHVVYHHGGGGTMCAWPFRAPTGTVTSSTLSGVLLDERVPEPACGAKLTIADSTAAGWSGPLGDELECEREPGHEGSHRYVAEWEGHPEWE